jgi:hypothetical protein
MLANNVFLFFTEGEKDKSENFNEIQHIYDKQNLTQNCTHHSIFTMLLGIYF